MFVCAQVHRIVQTHCGLAVQCYRPMQDQCDIGSMRTLSTGVFVLVLALVASSAGQASPSDSNNSDTLAEGSTQPSLPHSLRQLTDVGGVRSMLERRGLKFTFTHYSDAFANPVGGVRSGAGYDGRFGAIIDGDLAKLIGWAGATFHASIHEIYGTQYSATMLDNLMTVSGIEAPPSTRLFNLWIEKSFGEGLTLRVGQFTAAQEFMVSQNANLFVNSTFGWPALNAQDLPSGGPAYPEATPGVRLQITPDNQWTFRAAVFNGDPAGPGQANPVERDPYGLAFRVNDPPLLIAELVYAHGQQQSSNVENPHQEGNAPASKMSANVDLPGSISLGAWIHTGWFADQRLNQQGGLLGVSGGLPHQHAADYAIYGVIDQMVWRISQGSDRGMSVFLRATGVPSDRNLIDVYADAGLAFKGPLSTRPQDSAGAAIALARISGPAAASAQDIALATGVATPIPDFEATIEATYQWQLADQWIVQPNVQYVIHPGGHTPDPLQPTVPTPSAFVFGVRTILRF
jgi:porin